MFSSATPASLSTSMAVMAEPPVASYSAVGRRQNSCMSATHETLKTRIDQISRSALTELLNAEKEAGRRAHTNHWVAQENAKVSDIWR